MSNSPTANGQTALQTVRKREQGRTAWELSELIRPLREAGRHSVRQPRMLRHYPAVVEYVYNSRLATADQIRRRFASQIRSERTVQYQMARLVELGLLATAPVRSTSVHFPRVYLATEKGMSLIRDTYAVLGIDWRASPAEERKSRGRAMQTVLHELLLTEFELDIWEATENNEGVDVTSQERRFFRRENQLHFPDGGKIRRVEPDAGFMLTIGRGSEFTPMQYFVEMDMGSMSKARLRTKLQAYADWSRSEEGREWLRSAYGRFGDTPRVSQYRLLFICHDKLRPEADQERAVEILALAAELPRQMRNRIWVASVADLPHPDDLLSVFSAAVWSRAKYVSRDEQRRSSNDLAKRYRSLLA